jgi:hypothetical protein
MPRKPPHPDTLRVELAHALGFPSYPNDITAEPYLNYLTNRCIGRNTLETHFRLLMRVIAYFDHEIKGTDVVITMRSIQGLLDALSVDNEFSGHTTADIEDTVLYAIGTWTMLLSSFVLLPMAGGIRKVTLAYSLRAAKLLSIQPYEADLAGLIVGSGLLPAPSQYPLAENLLPSVGSLETATRLCSVLKQSPVSLTSAPSSPGLSTPSLKDRVLQVLHDLELLESLSINATRLNAYTLKVFGAVDIAWTHNLSRHLLLSKLDGQHILELFALPSALGATLLRSETVGISSDLVQEVRESYSLLFNAWPVTPWHTKFGAGQFCWCWLCSARRHRSRVIASYKRFSQHQIPVAKRSRRPYSSEYDPLLVDLMRNEPSDWTPDDFPHLWSRIVILQEHLQVAKPWSIWVLFRDRRDTLQFWTFL